MARHQSLVPWRCLLALAPAAQFQEPRPARHLGRPPAARLLEPVLPSSAVRCPGIAAMPRTLAGSNRLCLAARPIGVLGSDIPSPSIRSAPRPWPYLRHL